MPKAAAAPDPEYLSRVHRYMNLSRIELSRTIDYTARYEGHDYVIELVCDEGRTLMVCGWGEDPKKNDTLILQGPRQMGTIRYRVYDIWHHNVGCHAEWEAELHQLPDSKG